MNGFRIVDGLFGSNYFNLGSIKDAFAKKSAEVKQEVASDSDVDSDVPKPKKGFFEVK